MSIRLHGFPLHQALPGAIRNQARLSTQASPTSLVRFAICLASPRVGASPPESPSKQSRGPVRGQDVSVTAGATSVATGRSATTDDCPAPTLGNPADGATIPTSLTDSRVNNGNYPPS